MDTPVKLIVGLGNPGPKYERTRHNAGADFVATLAEHFGAALKEEKKFFGFTAKILCEGQSLRLLIPATYMNRSGQCVAAAARFFSLEPSALLVAHDDLDLPPGAARLKLDGGHGGHNGLRDTIKALGNRRDFGRLRLGIGHPGHADDVVDYVLRKAPREEQEQLADAIRNSIAVLPELAAGRWNRAMTTLHSN